MTNISFTFILFFCQFHIFFCNVFELDFIKKRHYVYNNNLSKYLMIYQETYPVVYTGLDEVLVSMCLGSPPTQCFDIVIDTGSYYLWVADATSANSTEGILKRFNSSASSTFISTNESYGIKYMTGSLTGFKAKDTLTLGGLHLNDFDFILANFTSGQTNIDGVIGFGYYYADYEPQATQFSLIDQLHEHQLIPKKIFTLKYTGESKGKLYIGDYPDEIKSDFENYGTCNAIKTLPNGKLNSQWMCNLTDVFLGNNTKSNDKSFIIPVVFDTGTSIILAPYTFTQFLFTNYFLEAINNNLCTGHNAMFYLSFTCKESVNETLFPDINFILDNWVLQMKPADLFKSNGTVKSFQIIGADEVDTWVLGEPFLKKYHMVFNKDSDQIGFSGKDKYRIRTSEASYMPYIIVIITLLGIMVLCLVLWVVAYRWKKGKHLDVESNSINVKFDISQPGH